MEGWLCWPPNHERPTPEGRQILIRTPSTAPGTACVGAVHSSLACDTRAVSPVRSETAASTPDFGSGLPSGTLTFLFTDIEASTRRWEVRPEAMRDAIAQHDEILRQVVDAHHGVIFKHTGDGIAAVFQSAPSGLSAALGAQKALQAADWPADDRLMVRMGLHAGEAEPTGVDYFGATVNRAARIMDIANGDQIAASTTVVALAPKWEFVSQGAHQLRGIGSEEIALVRHQDLPVDERPMRTRVPIPGQQVPLSLTGLIGRESDQLVLQDLLRQHRQVTVTGPGGVGKTSLAIEAARAMANEFSQPPAYCELGTVNDGTAVPELIAEALGARQQPDMDLTSSIVNYLDGRNVLLVLDNCEHLLDAVSEIVARILQVQGPRVLATSRQSIARSHVEQLMPLDPLDASTAATELFVTRALERDPKFVVSDASRADISAICQRLDGIPGAIELAAARVRVLAPAQLLDRLDDRFGVLRGSGRNDATSTLYDTVRWSYDQLDAAEAHLFEHLSVFAGGFDLEAVESIYQGPETNPSSGDPRSARGPEVIELLLSLVDKSMVAADRGYGRVRFQMLETMRAFGADRLVERGDHEVLRRRHSEYYAALAAHEADLLLTSKEVEVWTHLGQDWGNIRVAFESAVELDNFDLAAELVVSLSWFATFSMRFEALTWAGALIERPEAVGHERRGALSGAAALAAYFVADPTAGEKGEIALAEDPAEQSGLARGALAAVYLNNLHALDGSETITEQWLSTLTPDSLSANRLWAMGLRTFHLALNGHSEASNMARQTLAFAVETGSASALALGRWAEGLALVTEGRLGEAEAAWAEGLDSARSLSSQHLFVHLLHGLAAHFKAPEGDLASAITFTRSALQQTMDQHYLVGASHLFGVTAILLSRAGDAATGAALLGSMQSHGHVPRYPAIPMVRSALGDAYEAAAAVGTNWSVKQAFEVAVDALDSAALDHPNPEIS